MKPKPHPLKAGVRMWAVLDHYNDHHIVYRTRKAARQDARSWDGKVVPVIVKLAPRKKR